MRMGFTNPIRLRISSTEEANRLPKQTLPTAFALVHGRERQAAAGQFAVWGLFEKEPAPAARAFALVHPAV